MDLRNKTMLQQKEQHAAPSVEAVEPAAPLPVLVEPEVRVHTSISDNCVEVFYKGLLGVQMPLFKDAPHEFLVTLRFHRPPISNWVFQMTTDNFTKFYKAIRDKEAFRLDAPNTHLTSEWKKAGYSLHGVVKDCLFSGPKATFMFEIPAEHTSEWFAHMEEAIHKSISSHGMSTIAKEERKSELV